VYGGVNYYTGHSWQSPQKINDTIQLARNDRDKIREMMVSLDKEKTGRCPYTMFQQTAMDNNINFDKRSTKYIL